jgi:hypothetical protein
VVKAVGDTGYTILPLKAEDRKKLYLKVSSDWVERDPFPWTLRFQVGDKVICYGNGRWVPATVSKLFPYGDYSDCYTHCYKCDLDIPEGIHRYITAPRDDDSYIMKRPTTFRFSKGDEVIFATKEAAGLANKIWEPWIRGKITRVNIDRLRDYYAVYECSYKDRNKHRKCYILKDDDQHVASPDARPRLRLLEAIEQDCDYEHIDYLVTSFNMEVMVIKDILLSKATENGSYDALLWLQENASVDLKRIRDGQ